MFKNIQLSHYLIAMISLLLFVVQGLAQVGSCFSVGETGKFEVKPVPGTSYCWKVMEKLNLDKGSKTDKVTYLTSLNSPVIRLKWEKSGVFFLSVTGFNQDGCSNCKVFQIVVSDLHIPSANNDYVSTNWSNSIRIDLLRNDHDENNDIDSSSLRILTKTEFGDIVIGKSGMVIYTPRQNHGGLEKFYYEIGDSCLQKDTALVSIRISDPPFYLPQGISPNGDGMNDKFVIGGLDAYPGSSLTIFSRDGLTLYHNENYQNDWDGTQCNQNHGTRSVPPGTYYYLLRMGGTNRMIKGFFYLAE
jgi:gliding motility-associated-like protein